MSRRERQIPAGEYLVTVQQFGTVDQIIGPPKGAAYFHFPSKQALALAIIEQPHRDDPCRS
jgi:hypothetical protein